MKKVNQRGSTYHVDFIDSNDGQVLEYDDIEAYSLKDAKRDAQKLKIRAVGRLLSSGRHPDVTLRNVRTVVTLRKF